MAAGDEQDLIEAVVTCEGNLHDPDFQDRFRTLVDSLKTALYISKTKDPFRVRKIEPWNSVRVTISIPKEAAQKLKLLAQQGSNVLRSMGILSVQVEGDQVISLTWASQNSEPTQVILRQTSDEPGGSSSGTSGVSSSSLPASSPSLSSISSSVASISSPLPLTPGPSGGDGSGMAVTLDMLSSSSSSTLSFRSPNVVAPTGEAIPVLPPKGTAAGVRPPLGGPFPFVSMTHAAQAIHRSELSPLTSSVVSGGSGSNAANSTNSIVSSVPSSSSLLQQQGPTAKPNQSVPPPGLASSSPPGATVFVSTSSFVTGSVNSEPQQQVTRLIIDNATPQLVGSNVASLELSGTSSVALSHAGPSQSLQLQLVNVPPPYPGVNTISSNHSLSSSSSHSANLNVQSRNQTLSSGLPSSSSSPTVSLNSMLPSGETSVNQCAGGGFGSDVPIGTAASLSDSTLVSVSSMGQPLSSPLLVNLLQNNDLPSGSSLSSSSSDAYNQQKAQGKSGGKDSLQAKYLLQQQQQLKKTKRGLSLDGASSIPKNTPTGSSGPESKSVVPSPKATATATTPEQFQFVLPLPSDVSSGASMNRVQPPPASLSSPKTGIPNHSAEPPSSSNPLKGRTIVQGNIRLLDQTTGLVRTIPGQQQNQPPPPYPGALASSVHGKASTGGETLTTAHTHVPTSPETSLSNGPIPSPQFPQSTVVAEGDPKSQNSTIVTFVQSKEQHQVSSLDAASGGASMASLSADQSRTLLPITTVNIVSNSSTKSSASVNSSRESDSKTFIPPLDPRLSSQVQKLSHTSSNSVNAKNSTASNVVVQTASYNSDAKSSTSQLQQHIARTAVGNKRSPNRVFLPGQITSPGKPRQFLINPATGHLEPMPSESSSESEEGDESAGGVGVAEGETGRKSNSYKSSPTKNKAKGASLPVAFHRQIVTTETGVTVARVIKASMADPNLGVEMDGKKTVSQAIPGKGIPFPGNSTDASLGSVISVSKKLREDNSLTAALQTPKDSKDNSSPATVTATSVPGEKIKLRLKLEKNEPISQAYKVDVSFVKKSEKGSFQQGSTAVSGQSTNMTGSSSVPSSSVNSQTPPGEQPRVPPLHISLRGKNAAVVVSPRREEKDMPPPSTAITGHTKETVVVSKEANSSESPSTSYLGKGSHLLNSHDGKGILSGKPGASMKRVKSRVKSLDAPLDRNSVGVSGEKLKGKLSRPKLCKEVNDRRQLSASAIDEGKDSNNLTMPVLQPAILLPTRESDKKDNELVTKPDLHEIKNDAGLAEKVASPINNNVKSIKEPVIEPGHHVDSVNDKCVIDMNNVGVSDLKKAEKEVISVEHELSTNSLAKRTGTVIEKEVVSLPVTETSLIAKTADIVPLSKPASYLVDPLDASGGCKSTSVEVQNATIEPSPTIDDRSKGAFKIQDSPSVKGGDSTDEQVNPEHGKVGNVSHDYPQSELSKKDEVVVSSVISLSTDSCDIISKSSREEEGETIVEMDSTTGSESMLPPQQSEVAEPQPEKVPGATLTDTIQDQISVEKVDFSSQESVVEPSVILPNESENKVEEVAPPKIDEIIPETPVESKATEDSVDKMEIEEPVVESVSNTTKPISQDAGIPETSSPAIPPAAAVPEKVSNEVVAEVNLQSTSETTSEVPHVKDFSPSSTSLHSAEVKETGDNEENMIIEKPQKTTVEEVKELEPETKLTSDVIPNATVEQMESNSGNKIEESNTENPVTGKPEENATVEESRPDNILENESIKSEVDKDDVTERSSAELTREPPGTSPLGAINIVSSTSTTDTVINPTPISSIVEESEIPEDEVTQVLPKPEKLDEVPTELVSPAVNQEALSKDVAVSSTSIGETVKNQPENATEPSSAIDAKPVLEEEVVTHSVKEIKEIATDVLSRKEEDIPCKTNKLEAVIEPLPVAKKVVPASHPTTSAPMPNCEPVKSKYVISKGSAMETVKAIKIEEKVDEAVVNSPETKTDLSLPQKDKHVTSVELKVSPPSNVTVPTESVLATAPIPVAATKEETVKVEPKDNVIKPIPKPTVVEDTVKVVVKNDGESKIVQNSKDTKPPVVSLGVAKLTPASSTPKKEKSKLVPQLVSVGAKSTTKVVSVKPKNTTTIVEKVETVSDLRGNSEKGDGDVNVTIMTPKKAELPVSTTSAPPISIVLPSESLRSGNSEGKVGTKATYKRRAEIKPGALQNTLKRLHDNLPKVSKTSEKQDALTQSAKAAASANADNQERSEKERIPVTVNANPVKAVPNKMPTLSQSVSIAIPQVRPMPTVMQRPKLAATSTSATATLHQIQGGLQSNIIPNVSIGISSAALTSVASISVASSSSCGQPQTVFAIHPNVSIPANFAQLQQSQVVLSGGHKMLPIKLVTLPKQSGGQIQTIPLGAGNPNRASPNLLEAVNIVANAGSRSSSPKTTLIGNAVQPSPLNLSSMSLPVGSNLHFVPISVSSASGTTGNVKVLMTQPIKMSQQSGLSQSMVLNSVLMGNQPATIRVIRPTNLQEPIAFKQLIKTAPDQATVKKVVKTETPATETSSKPEFTVQSDSLFKKLDGVEIVDTGSPLNNDDLPFEADIIHDEKDLADVLAAEAKAEVVENCVKPATAAAEVKTVPVKGNHSRAAVDPSGPPVENHVSSKKLLSISRAETSTLDSPVSAMRVASPLYTYSAAPKTRDPPPVTQTPSPAVPDLHGEDEEIINSFSRSPSQPRLSPQIKTDNVLNDMKAAELDVISDHSYGMSSNSALANCDSSNSLGQELSIEIPPIDMEVAFSPSQNPPEGKRCTRSTRSNPRLSPDITAFVSETKTNKVSNKVDLMSLRSSPKPSPTGSLKVLSPTPSSLTITPSTSTRSSPILHNQHQINANNAAATINAVAMGIIDKIQGNASAQNAKNSRISKLSGTNKRKRQESDSSSASRDENIEDKAEIDLNSRPGKRKCSENAAEMIKVCIGVEDSPKRNSSIVVKKTEDVKIKDGKGKKGMTPLLEEDDDVDSEVSGSRGRSGRSSRESSEDRSSSRGSSAQRVVVTDKAKPVPKEKEEEPSKETKSNRTNSRTTKEVTVKAKTQPVEKASPHPNATAAKKAKESGPGKATPKRVNRPNSKNKSSPLTPAKTRTNVRKDVVATPTGSEKNATSVSTSTATPETENARRKTRSSAAGKRHVT